jgi:type I restriction enzyme S subunit
MYYNNRLLSFETHKYYSLEELCDIVDYRGKTPKKVDNGIFLVTAKNIRQGYIDYEKSKEYIAAEDYEITMRRGKPKKGDVLITTEAPCGNVAQIDNENIALAQRVIKYRPKVDSLDSTFLKYILLGSEFQSKLLSASTGGTVKGIKGSKLHRLTVPLPPLSEQLRIVEILNRFDDLCNDISEDLPAEIKARQQQYEYYRDKLLTFKEKEVYADA